MLLAHHAARSRFRIHSCRIFTIACEVGLCSVRWFPDKETAAQRKWATCLWSQPPAGAGLDSDPGRSSGSEPCASPSTQRSRPQAPEPRVKPTRHPVQPFPDTCTVVEIRGFQTHFPPESPLFRQKSPMEAGHRKRVCKYCCGPASAPGGPLAFPICPVAPRAPHSQGSNLPFLVLNFGVWRPVVLPSCPPPCGPCSIMHSSGSRSQGHVVRAAWPGALLDMLSPALWSQAALSQHCFYLSRSKGSAKAPSCAWVPRPPPSLWSPGDSAALG